MVDRKTYLKKSRDIVIHNSERYRIFLDDYTRDSLAAGYPIDAKPYLTAIMNGIYTASLNEAMWSDWDSVDTLSMVDRVSRLHDQVTQMADRAGVDLHTPSYACMIIYTSLTGADPSENELREIRSLDKSIFAFFDHARNQVIDRMYSMDDPPSE